MKINDKCDATNNSNFSISQEDIQKLETTSDSQEQEPSNKKGDTLASLPSPFDVYKISNNKTIAEKKITLPYPGNQTICLPLDWNVKYMDFTYTCYHPRGEFWGGQSWYSETRSAFAIETPDQSQRLYYCVLPDNIHTFSDFAQGLSPNVDEFKNAITQNFGTRFYEEPNHGRNLRNVIVKGTWEHDSLGKGTWKAHLYGETFGPMHILLTISPENKDNELFFEQCEKMCL